MSRKDSSRNRNRVPTANVLVIERIHISTYDDQYSIDPNANPYISNMFQPLTETDYPSQNFVTYIEIVDLYPAYSMKRYSKQSIC